MSEANAAATKKKLPRLHELIAVKSNLRTQAAGTMSDLGNTFEKKKHLFTGKQKKYRSSDEKIDAKVEEQLDIETTVIDELNGVKKFIVNAINGNHAVNTGNRTAAADIVLENDMIIATRVPSITLLELEDDLLEIRRFADKIPTLDPAKGFAPDKVDGRPGIWVARVIEKVRTKKENKVIVKLQPTDKHPGQAEIVVEDTPVGTIEEHEWSSMMRTVDKANLLERIDMLLRAVKKARSRANEEEVTLNPIGEKLVSYIFG